MVPARLYLDLGLPAYRTLRNALLLVKLPTTVHCCGNPSRPEEGAFDSCSSLLAACRHYRRPLQQFSWGRRCAAFGLFSVRQSAWLCPPPPSPPGSRGSMTVYCSLLWVVHSRPTGNTHLWLVFSIQADPSTAATSPLFSSLKHRPVFLLPFRFSEHGLDSHSVSPISPVNLSHEAEQEWWYLCIVLSRERSTCLHTLALLDPACEQGIQKPCYQFSTKSFKNLHLELASLKWNDYCIFVLPVLSVLHSFFMYLFIQP